MKVGMFLKHQNDNGHLSMLESTTRLMLLTIDAGDVKCLTLYSGGLN